MKILRKIKFKRPPEKYTMPIWWLCQIGTSYTYTNAFVGLNKPDIMPLAGGLATVLAYLLYTRQKGLHDEKAREHQLELMRVMARKDADIDRVHLHNRKGDIEKIYYEIGKLKYDLAKEKRDLEEKAQKVSSSPQWSLGGITSSSLHNPIKASMPRQDLSYSRQNVDINGYQATIDSYMDAIKSNQRFAERFAILEAATIAYTAALSAFGADLVRWVHS